MNNLKNLISVYLSFWLLSVVAAKFRKKTNESIDFGDLIMKNAFFFSYFGSISFEYSAMQTKR